ncbi:MAG: hypothetical protein IPH03_00925 [Tetrasphaera sp.]|nr:hypothetical protein [Tetrasphaera sp.]
MRGQAVQDVGLVLRCPAQGVLSALEGGEAAADRSGIKDGSQAAELGRNMSSGRTGVVHDASFGGGDGSSGWSSRLRLIESRGVRTATIAGSGLSNPGWGQVLG